MGFGLRGLAFNPKHGPMDPTRPYKIVRVPTAWGILSGITGDLLDEYDSAETATTMMYELWLEDRTLNKSLLYRYEVTTWTDVVARGTGQVQG